MDLAETLMIATEIEAASAGMVKRCSGYQETTRVLHRELEYLLQLHHKEPGIFNLNPEINKCAADFFKASTLISQDAERVRSLGLDNAERNLHRVS